MIGSTLEQVRLLATRFREGMEATDFSDTGYNLQAFPRECCHHASNLLGLYLFDQGLGPFRVVLGRRGNPSWREHVWLMQGGLIVDITPDQFPDWDGGKVLVTRHSDWHDSWERMAEERVIYGQDYYERIRKFYGDVYPRVLAAIELVTRADGE